MAERAFRTCLVVRRLARTLDVGEAVRRPQPAERIRHAGVVTRRALAARALAARVLAGRVLAGHEPGRPRCRARAADADNAGLMPGNAPPWATR
jgi:hypothetical protein